MISWSSWPDEEEICKLASARLQIPPDGWGAGTVLLEAQGIGKDFPVGSHFRDRHLQVRTLGPSWYDHFLFFPRFLENCNPFCPNGCADHLVLLKHDEEFVNGRNLFREFGLSVRSLVLVVSPEWCNVNSLNKPKLLCLQLLCVSCSSKVLRCKVTLLCWFQPLL